MMKKARSTLIAIIVANANAMAATDTTTATHAAAKCLFSGEIQSNIFNTVMMNVAHIGRRR